jgi:hypothetical protein
MANPEHVEIILKGAKAIATWRKQHQDEEFDLRQAGLISTNLHGADLSQAVCAWTRFINMDLSSVKGLEKVCHINWSTIGVDTLYKSKGKIPAAFLRGCGVPENLIECLPSLTNQAVNGSHTNR